MTLNKAYTIRNKHLLITIRIKNKQNQNSLKTVFLKIQYSWKKKFFFLFYDIIIMVYMIY